MKSTNTWDFPVRKSWDKKPKSKLVEVTINPALNDALVTHLTLADSAREYLKVKGQIERLTDKLKVLRVPLEEALAVNGEPMEIGEHVWALQNCTRENFRLKEAKHHLKAELLSPFISVSKYTKLVPSGKK